MKEALIGCVQGQIYGNMDKVDAKELGEAIDMIKDLAETIYFCTITEAMEKEEKEEGGESKHRMMYYNQRMMPAPMYNYPMEYYDPRLREKYMPDSMYAQGGGSGSGGSSSGGSDGSGDGSRNAQGNGGYDSSSRGNNARGGGNRNYPPMEMIRDPKEGKSGERRKMYMESRYSGKDKSKQMQELEGYMQELTQDLTEMIQDASPEEKQLLQQKISTLATKIK